MMEWHQSLTSFCKDHHHHHHNNGLRDHHHHQRQVPAGVLPDQLLRQRQECVLPGQLLQPGNMQVELSTILREVSQCPNALRMYGPINGRGCLLDEPAS